MKTIGLIGGMSWESTVTYYQILNRTIQEKLGGLHSARCLLYSVDFQEIEECQSSGAWEESGRILADAAVRLERAGANVILICTNTMHKVAPQVQRQIGIPLLHIADATLKRLQSSSIRRVALLGTRYTMEQEFYKARLIERGIEVLIPDEADRKIVNNVIYDELCKGVILPSSKQEYLRIMRELAMRGAEGVILGCTEIGLLVGQADTELPLFDTTQIHAEAAAIYSIED